MLRMNRPTGVTVISILYFIGAGFFALLGLVFIVGGAAIAASMAERTGMPAALVAGAGVFIAVLFLVISAFHVFIGWGILRLKEWARIIAIVLAGLGALGGVFGLIRFSFMGLVRLAISGWIIWYLLQPHVVAAFRGVSTPTIPPPVPQP
jgi:hypothetical protein